MPKLRIPALLVFCVTMGLSRAPAHAAECGDLKQFIKDETAGPDKFVDTFSFRRNHRADSVLMLVKDSVQKGRLPKRWLFLHRGEKDTDYCVSSRGEEFGQHEDVHDNAFVAQFGPSGSGLERCATSDADTPASLKLRAWANRELGSSIILYTVAEKTSGFQFIISDDQDWIIIEDKKDDPQTSCYFDRGTDVFMRFNITVVQP
jgi:hypothetical protein